MGTDIYFASGIVRSLGRMFFLRVPQEAPDGATARKLLGSYVVEIDYGLLGLKEAPGLDHAWQPEYFLKQAAQVPDLAEMDLVLDATLGGFSQTYRVETKAGLNIKASFPASPVGAGIELNYSKIKSAKVTLDPGSRKLYIPRGYMETAYRYFATHSDKYNPVVFNSNRMLIDQIVIAKNMKVEVESHSTFDADFQAKATHISDLGAGVTFSRKSDRTYEIAITDDKEYLFAVGAQQADKFAD